MPSLPTTSLRRGQSESDDGEESETADPSPQYSNKRRRLESDDPQSDDDGVNGSRVGDGESDDDTPSETQPLGTTRAASLGASQNGHPDSIGRDGFKPGSIVRIKLTDFVTYTSAEFFLGPKLNMVIGPNGTGKSTLVCAICLGLGWGPQVCSLLLIMPNAVPLTIVSVFSTWDAPKTRENS